MMKKLLVLLCSVGVMFSCTEKPFLNFAEGQPDSIVAEAEVSAHTVKFSTNVDWQATASVTWIRVSPSSGGAGSFGIAVEIEENETYDKRVGHVTVSAEGLSHSVAVTQNAREGYVVEETSFRIGSEGGTITVPVAANVDYEVAVDDECSSWLSVTQTKGLGSYQVKLAVKANTTYDERMGQVRLSAKGQSSLITITQSQLDEMIVGQREFEIGNEGGEIRVPVQANVEYSCAVLGEAEWITVASVGTRGLEETNVVLNIDANPGHDGRVGQVKVAGAGKESVVTVTQAQTDEMIVSVTEYEIGSDGGEIKVPVLANVDYVYEVLDEGKDWLSVSSIRTKGLEETRMVISVEANEGYDSRVGRIKVSGAGKESLVTVTQSQLDEMILAATEYEIGSDGGEIKVPVQANVSYECEVLESGEGWITVKSVMTKGLEETFAVLTIQANDSYSGRVGQVKVSGAGKESVITVTQSLLGEIILITSEYEIGYEGGAIKVPVLANIDYECEVLESGEGWIEVKSMMTKGLERTNVVLNIRANERYDNRVGQVRVIGEGKESFITVTQRQLDAIILEKSEYEISFEGGSLNIPVSSNVEYSAEVLEDIDWIKIAPAKTKALEVSELILEVAENMSIDSRTGKVKISGEGKEHIVKVVQGGITGVVNLSSAGTANSYIVSGPGYYKFNTTKGNSSESVGSVSSAEVLWETFGTDTTPNKGELVSMVSYSNNEVIFSVPEAFKEGNASIAAKDADGNILWSWHIWLTDKPEDQVYLNNAGTMMDRNLGATSATPGDVGALGLLYQWGRKDPFLGSSSISESVKAVSTLNPWPNEVSSNTNNGTIEYAIANPTTFIRAYNNDWYYSTASFTTDHTRWESTKTIYDPCPKGYKVPDYDIWNNAFDYVSKEDGAKLNSSPDLDKKGFDLGIKETKNPLTDEEICWYPFTGFYDDGGSLGYTGSIGYYRSVSIPSKSDLWRTSISCRIYSDQKSVYADRESWGFDLGYAMSVRCQKIE